jgi:hypothetical protein
VEEGGKWAEGEGEGGGREEERRGKIQTPNLRSLRNRHERPRADTIALAHVFQSLFAPCQATTEFAIG